MQLSKLLIISSLALFLAACETLSWDDVTDVLTIKEEPIKHTIIIQERPKPLSLGKIEWHTVNDRTLDEFIEDIKEKEGMLVFDAIRIKDYETLAKNLAELERYILQQKEIIRFYEESIKEMNRAAEKTEQEE